MFQWINKILDSNEREINHLRPLVAQINALEPEFERKSDAALRELMEQFREQLADGATTLDRILPEVFAAVREAAKRAIGQRHYDVQLMGGVTLHSGKIAEMKTGEGKTLVATLPVALNALSGDGVHVVTVNDYLAKRDTQWMGTIYSLLGLSVGCIQHDAAFIYDVEYSTEDPLYIRLRPVSRREAYDADITYGTNNEFGFDYLRDNMVTDLSMCVQPDLNFAIVDEVDNILIDEARTPLIISGQAEESAEQYQSVSRLVPQLHEQDDYLVDEKTKSVSLSERGIASLEQWLRIPNLYDSEHFQITHFVETALKAHVLYKRDRDYIVRNGEVVIVDEFTGRQMPGRRWSDGLHQAIEAKENVKIQRESLTLATITFQNYFRLYNKLAGMTGTAVTEAEEFHKIYKLEVVVVPTNQPMVRGDQSDLVYKNEKAKFQAVTEEIKELHEKGQPILVGTVSVEKSEYLGELLKRVGVEHQVLNAKFHQQEASIVAQAGRSGTVTIATNMAGRGTDIVLGGNPDGLAFQEALRHNIDPEDEEGEYPRILAALRTESAEDHKRVVNAGGLHIIGTERHEARRIDNQLRGRAGRQGDPGSSRFYVSLEDDVMRRFGGDRIRQFMDWAGLEDDVPIEHALVNKSLENAQTKVESHNFDIRKHLVDYDDVMNTQRTWVYQERHKILEGADLRSNVLEMVHGELTFLMNTYLQGRDSEDWDIEGLFMELGGLLPEIPGLTVDDFRLMTRSEAEETLHTHADSAYEAREGNLGEEHTRLLERLVLLQTIDNLWVSHLTAIEEMRQGIGLRAVAQTDPLVAYKREAYQMYEELRENIRRTVARTIYRVSLIQQQQTPAPVAQNVQTNQSQRALGQGAAVPASPFGRQAQPARQTAPATPGQGRKLGRNEICWCGSGRKFKRCHGA